MQENFDKYFQRIHLFLVQFITNKKVQTIFIISVVILLIAPFLILALGTSPSTDDYCYAVDAKDQGLIGAMIDEYKTWNGRFSATAFLTWSPTTFNSVFLYQLSAIFLIITTLLALTYLISQLFRTKQQRFSLRFSLGMATIFLFIFINSVPILSDAFYWHAGSWTYQTSNILLTILIGNLLYVANSNLSEKSSRFKIIFFINLLLIFFTAGFNEVMMTLQISILSIITFFQFFRNFKYKWYGVLYVATSVFGALVVYVAPGNSVRQSYESTNAGIFAAINSSLSFSKHIVAEWINIPLLALTLCVGFAGWYLRKNNKFIRESFNIDPILSLLITVAIVFIGYIPPFYSIGNPGPERAQNTIYWCFLLAWFATAISFSTFFEDLKIWNNKTFQILTIPAIGLMGIGYLAISPTNEYRRAIGDLIQGDFKNYKDVISTRNTEIEEIVNTDNGFKSITFSPLPSEPKIITNKVRDITPSNGHWINRCYREYYGLDEVLLESS